MEVIVDTIYNFLRFQQVEKGKSLLTFMLNIRKMEVNMRLKYLFCFIIVIFLKTCISKNC